MDLCFKVLDSEMNTKAVSKGVDEVSLVYSQPYVPGCLNRYFRIF